MNYGAWYAWADQTGHSWTHIKVELVDEFLPTTYYQVTSRGARRKPEDAGFFASYIDSADGHLSHYSPPMVDPPGWRPGEEPRKTGTDYLAWLEGLISAGTLVEAPGVPRWKR